jgi:MFS family permease
LSATAPSSHDLSLAVFTINIAESNFRHTQVPYVLIQAGGYTATQAGAALLPLPLVIAVTSPGVGALAARLGPRWLLITGPVIVAAGFLLTLRIGSATSYWLGVFPAMVMIALGMACAVAPLTTTIATRVQHPA